MFYLVCKTKEERIALIKFLAEKGVNAVFHFQSLHKSMFYASQYAGAALPNADRFTDCLVRLPLYFEMTEAEVNEVSNAIISFYK